MHFHAVAARLSRVLADLLANPPPASLIHPVIDWTKAMGAVVRQAPLRLLLQNSDNKVSWRKYLFAAMAETVGWGCALGDCKAV